MTNGVRRSIYPAALVLLSAVYCALFIYCVYASIVRAPVFDLMEWVLFWDAKRAAGDWFGFFWDAYNQHRIVISRALLVLDLKLTSGTAVPFIIFGAGLLATSIAIILRRIWKTALRERASLVVLALFALAPTYIAVMCSMPSMGVFLYTCSFVIFSLALLPDASERSSVAHMRRGAAIVSCAISAFGVSGGVLGWPVLLWYAWRRGYSYRWLGGVAVIAAIFVAFYFHGGGGDASHELSLQSLVARFDYLVRFLGLPWSHAPQLVFAGRTLGVALLVTMLWLLVSDTLTRPSRDDAELFGLALLLFVMLVAMAAAAARWNIAADREMPVRYGMFITLAHAGLVMVFGRKMSAKLEGRHAALAKAALLAACAILIAQQALGGIAAIRETSLYTTYWNAFTKGDWQPEMQRYVYPDRPTANAAFEMFKREGIYQVK